MYEKQKMTFERAAEILDSANEACEIGRKAILKQIPKKPLFFNNAECPNCPNEFEFGSNNWGCAYCPNCGQALDWSKHDE